MDILKHQFPIKSLIFLKSNCHAKMAPDNGFDEQAIVRRRAAHMAFTTRQNVFDPIPLIVAQCISSHRSALLGADHSERPAIQFLFPA